jgi:Holliday junction DNA helicase RuvB
MIDKTLPPASWDAFIGQQKLKDRFQIKIDATLNRYEPLGDILLYSGPGLGKSSLAKLVADNLEQKYTTMDMPVKSKALAKTFLETEGVLVLDEIHRLSKKDQENLLPVLWKRVVQFDNGKQHPIPKENHLTIIGATTELAEIIKPLRERFSWLARFEPYTDDDMAQIVKRMAKMMDLSPSEEEAIALGKASASTPRQARNLILTARDLDTTNPTEILEVAGITKEGLTEEHVEYMLALGRLDNRAGVDNLSNLLGLPKDILKELEHLLINKGYLVLGPKGRELTIPGMQKVREFSQS